MKHYHNNTNALLVEIMIAVLFFSLCATVILQLLVSVRQQSLTCRLTSEAMIPARNTAEMLSVADDPAEALRQMHFEPEETTADAEQKWISHADGYDLLVSAWTEEMSAGQLEHARIQAVRQLKETSQVLLTLETAHYRAEVE